MKTFPARNGISVLIGDHLKTAEQEGRQPQCSFTLQNITWGLFIMKEAAISNYREGSRKLFDEWKTASGLVEYTAKQEVKTLRIDHRNSVFIKDGVVCPDVWFSCDVRPLFLLKEAYGGKEDWDLIQDILQRIKR